MLDVTNASFSTSVPVVAITAPPMEKWSYEKAFQRNRGLITEVEQQRLRNCRVAIAGMGGVGGVHLTTLARLGIGKFTIADPDEFDVANFNRQYGATTANLGSNKAEAMANLAREINPEIDIRVMPTAVGPENIEQFLADADLYVDGLDFFAVEARRLAFRRAAERGIWSVTAGPIGFSTAWLAFDPTGMSFDRYFDINDNQTKTEQLVAFAVGLAPRATHLSYIDLNEVDLANQAGPSASLACQLASGVVGAEAIKILLNKPNRLAAPTFAQFDPYRMKLRRGRLRFGNRGFVQKLKRRFLLRRVSESDAAKGSNRGGKFPSLPPIHKYAPLILKQAVSTQKLERRPEPETITANADNVAEYDRVMTTKLAVAYAVGVEVIHRVRQLQMGGTALDLACGPGHFSLCMTKYLQLDQLVGLDLSKEMVQTAGRNALQQNLQQASFDLADVTNLARFPENQFDLTTFTDAAHHMDEIETVRNVLEQADRVTKPEGLVVLMDLVRLKNAKITESYVQLVGGGYHQQGLSLFYDDFYNSMFAAWTVEEMSHAVPQGTGRNWFQLSPRFLPTIQFLFGVPKRQTKLFQRKSVPWDHSNHPLNKELRAEWQSLRQMLKLAKPKRIKTL